MLTVIKKQINQLQQQIPVGAKLREWIMLTSITSGTQLLIQVIGLLSGIVIIRLLSTQEYALYTLANTMLGTMTVLADGGVSSGVMAESGKVWRDRDKLGTALVTGLDLRKKFAVASLVISSPFLIYLMILHGASWWISIIIILSLIPAFIGSLSGSIFAVPLQLHQDVRSLQKNQLVENISRFAGIFSLIILPWTFIALLASGIPKIITNLRLQKYSTGYANWSVKPDQSVRKRIIKMVKRLMPGMIYFVLSGHISLWLISLLGSTDNVAEIGAIGRLAIIFTVVTNIFNVLIIPRFTRLPENSTKVFSRFFKILIAFAVLSLIIVVFVYLFSSQILWVLGEKYQNLNYELFLAVVTTCLVHIGGGAFRMSNQRGWPIHPALSISVSVASVIAGVMIFEISTLVGVLYFNIFTAFIQIILNVGYFVFAYFTKTEKVTSA